MKISRSLAFVLLVIIFLGGWLLRLYQLDKLPLRGDEAFSAQYWAGLPLSQSLTQIATIEPHPPLTYVFFRAWGIVFGIQHELVLRLLPVLGNLIGMAAVYATGKRLQGRAVGLLAALFWALHPFELFHAQDFRNYGLWAGLSAVTLWLALRAMQRRRTGDWVLFAGAALLSSLTFYMEILTLGVLGIFVLWRYRQERGFLLKWVGLNAGIVAVVGACFFVLQAPLLLSGGYAGTTRHLDPIQLITRFLPALNFGEKLPAELLAPLGIVLMLLFVGLGILLLRYPDQRLIGLLALLPPFAIGIISLKMGVFDPRYALSAAAGFMLWVALAVIRLIDLKGGWRWVGTGLLISWLMLNTYSLFLYFATPSNRPDWRGLAAYLAAYTQPDDLVIQLATDAGFGYYYDEVFRVPVPDIGLPANFDQSPAEVEADLAKHIPQYRSVWIVASTFPDWLAAGVVEAWMPQHLQQVRHTSIHGLPIQQYMTWEVDPAELSATSLGTFANTVDLRGAQVFLPPEPTDEVTIWLYWQPQQTSITPHKVFIHLIGDINPTTGTPLWAQVDSFPQQGRIQTTDWSIGQLYRDVYALNIADVPAGEYQLVVGWYDPDSGERWLTHELQDYLLIQTITLSSRESR